MANGEMRIEYFPLKEVLGWPANPKLHELGKLGDSIDRFGFNDAPTIDERTKRLVEGHGRIEALKQMKANGDKPPLRVHLRTEDGEWMVPICRGISFENETEAEAYLLAHNRITELGGWDDAGLSAMLERARPNLAGIGWDTKELDKILAASKPEPTEDTVPEPPKKPVSKLGMLWLLGEHRLLCGDSTKSDDVKRLYAGDVPFIMVTDPPYGVEYDPEWREDLHDKVGAVTSIGKVMNDDKADWTAAYRLFPGNVMYVWHASWFISTVQANIQACNFGVRSLIIWAKQHFAMSRGAYHWQHEPCWYAVRDGKPAKWSGDRSQTTLWQIDNKSSFGGSKDDADTTHGTQKPIQCMYRPIKNHGGPDDIVYDPFLGSGTTLIAAQQLDRKCLGLELDPAYADIIVERWEQFTGGKAKRG